MRKIHNAVQSTIIVDKDNFEKKYGIFAFGKTGELYARYDDGLVDGYSNCMAHIYTLEEAQKKIKEIRSFKKSSSRDNRIDYNRIYIYKISGSHLSTVLKETGRYYKIEWKEREQVADLIRKGYSNQEIQKVYFNAPSKLSIINNVRFRKIVSIQAMFNEELAKSNLIMEDLGNGYCRIVRK